jgi:eukaryotic-like serine/threonine-protein kinase
MYIAMELLKGKSLHDIFHDEAPLPWQRVFNILEQMCSSLGEAHQAGIVHRDLKPENVYLENRAGQPDYVKILDFGIAKIVSGEIGGGSASPQLTQTGQTLGTLEYMSPEQLMGKQLDGRSDIYALGVVAYELLTGQLPFPDAKGPAELIAAQLKKTPPPPSTIKPEMRVPPGVDAVIARMLEKGRDKRFADVAALRDSVAHVMATGGQLPPFASQAMPAMAQAPAAAPPAAFRPMTPAPQMAPPSMQPMVQPMGPPPAMQSMQPMGPPSVQPMGPPPMSMPPQQRQGRRVPSTQEAIAASKGSGNLWLWIILAAFLLGGGAAAVYFAFLR